MTKLEAGAIVAKREMIDLGEIVGTALQRAARVLANHRVRIDMAQDLPMLLLDFVLLASLVQSARQRCQIRSA